MSLNLQCGREGGFFEAQALSMNKIPDRAVAHLNTASGKLFLQTAQCQVRLFGKALMNELPMPPAE
jgi:hypothetical protein